MFPITEDDEPGKPTDTVVKQRQKKVGIGAPRGVESRAEIDSNIGKTGSVHHDPVPELAKQQQDPNTVSTLAEPKESSLAGEPTTIVATGSDVVAQIPRGMVATAAPEDSVTTTTAAPVSAAQEGTLSEPPPQPSDVEQKPIVKAKLFDCFLFHSEMDLLEIHIGELFDVVDSFILVEAAKSLTNTSKPLIYAEHRNRLQTKFQEKIFHVVIEDFEELIAKYDDPIYNQYGIQWKRERAQRERIWQALRDAGIQPGDLINLGDVDEIPNPKALNDLKKGCDRVEPQRETKEQQESCKEFPVPLPLTNYVYNFRWNNRNTWFTTQVFRYNGSNLETVSRSSIGVARVANQRHVSYTPEEEGWHCSWCYPTLKDLQRKFARSAHAELNIGENTHIDNINASVCEGKAMFRKNHPPWNFTMVEALHVPSYVREHSKRFGYLMPKAGKCDLPLGEDYPTDQARPIPREGVH